MGADEADRRAAEVLRDLGAEGDKHRGMARPDPDRRETVGTGLRAGVSSFICFGCGAFIPVLPYLLGVGGITALVVAAVLVGAALLATGAIVGLISGGSPLRPALRQLLIGYGAATITYLLGLLFHTSVG